MKKIAADRNYYRLKKMAQSYRPYSDNPDYDPSEPRSGLPLNASLGAVRGSSDQAIIDLIVELEGVIDCKLFLAMSDYVFPENPRTFNLCGEWEYYPHTAEEMAEYGNNRRDLIRTVQLAQAVHQNPGGDPKDIARSLGMVTSIPYESDSFQPAGSSVPPPGPGRYDL